MQGLNAIHGMGSSVGQRKASRAIMRGLTVMRRERNSSCESLGSDSLLDNKMNGQKKTSFSKLHTLSTDTHYGRVESYLLKTYA